MDMEAQVRDAIRSELERQAEAAEGGLSLAQSPDGLRISGQVDLEALAMAVVGAVAGGP